MRSPTDERAGHAEQATDDAHPTLEELLDAATPTVAPTHAMGGPDVLVGEVVDARHPKLRARVRVRWHDPDGHRFERWLPTLQGLPVREGDRVLMSRAANFAEHIVTGVVDGFTRRPAVERDTAARLEMKRDEALRVVSQEGEPLLEVFELASGPVVRLLRSDVDIDLEGRLRIRAAAIELEAKQGQARITASDDVVLRGEAIHLN